MIVRILMHRIQKDISMKKLLMLVLLLIYHFSMYSAACSSDAGEQPACPLAELIHIFASKSYPHIAMKCIESVQPGTWLSNRSNTAICFLVGHDDQGVRDELLQQWNVEDLKDIRACDHFLEQREKFMSSQSTEELAKSKLFLAVIQAYFTFNGQKCASRFVTYEAYDLKTHAYSCGHFDNFRVSDEMPHFGIFKSGKNPNDSDLMNYKRPRHVQAFEEP